MVVISFCGVLFLALFHSFLVAFQRIGCEIHVIPSIEFRWLLLSWRCQTARLSKGQGSSSVASCRKNNLFASNKKQRFVNKCMLFFANRVIWRHVLQCILYDFCWWDFLVHKSWQITAQNAHGLMTQVIKMIYSMTYCLPVAFVVSILLNDARRFMFGLCKCVVFMDDCKSSDVIIDHHRCFRFLLFGLWGNHIPAV